MLDQTLTQLIADACGLPVHTVEISTLTTGDMFTHDGKLYRYVSDWMNNPRYARCMHIGTQVNGNIHIHLPAPVERHYKLQVTRVVLIAKEV